METQKWEIAHLLIYFPRDIFGTLPPHAKKDCVLSFSKSAKNIIARGKQTNAQNDNFPFYVN